MRDSIRGVELNLQFPHGSTRIFNFSVYSLYRSLTEYTGGIQAPLSAEGSQLTPLSVCRPTADVSCAFLFSIVISWRGD